jgi:hypothetical protein
MAAADPKKKFRWTNLLVITWDCLKIVYPKANGSWSLSLLNGYHWGYTLFSDKPIYSDEWHMIYMNVPPILYWVGHLRESRGKP